MGVRRVASDISKLDTKFLLKSNLRICQASCSAPDTLIRLTTIRTLAFFAVKIIQFVIGLELRQVYPLIQKVLQYQCSGS